MSNEAESRRNRVNCHRHFMGGCCGTRSRRHTEGQESGGRRGAEESAHRARRKGDGEGE